MFSDRSGKTKCSVRTVSKVNYRYEYFFKVNIQSFLFLKIIGESKHKKFNGFYVLRHDVFVKF